MNSNALVLAAIGTLSVHVLLFVGADAIAEHTYREPEVAPVLDSFEITLPPPPPLPPEIPEVAPPEPAKPEPVAVKPVAAVKAPRPTTRVQQDPQPTRNTEVPPANQPNNPDAGGTPVYAMDNTGPAAKGVAVAVGKPSTGKTGRGGTGGGSGTGDGAGSGAGVAPLSIASIKTRAMPKGDYSYFSEYPEEAKRLGISGQVRVRLVVSPQGKVVEKRILKGLGYGLDELALAKAATMEFTPALDSNDQPVTSVVVWTFNMQLPS